MIIYKKQILTTVGLLEDIFLVMKLFVSENDSLPFNMSMQSTNVSNPKTTKEIIQITRLIELKFS